MKMLRLSRIRNSSRQHELFSLINNSELKPTNPTTFAALLYAYPIYLFGLGNLKKTYSKLYNTSHSMRGSRQFCQRGSSFDSHFLVDERIQITL